MLPLVLFAGLLGQVAPVPVSEPAPSPDRVLVAIRERFRSHGPPPPFVSYTLSRVQNAVSGEPDYQNSYVKHVWVRTSDRAALTRLVFRNGDIGPLTFDRPAFNEARDPGPPTWDPFADTADADYKVESMIAEGPVLHLRIAPVRDPARFRLRELFADARTYELRKIVAMDRLFVDRGPTYPVTMTITMGSAQGVPVVNGIYGVVGGGYNDDGREMDYAFSSVTFPNALPDWYFEPRTYGQHERDAPS
jgi:hypothetical protein